MQPSIIFTKRVPGLSQATLAEFVAKAGRVARLRGTVTLMVTDDREIQALNLQFKGSDRPTDVLSFPAPVFVQGFAGDIAISGDYAARNARRLGHRVSDEIRILALHGILHLAGYDHENDNGEMARRELRMRTQLKLPTGLIERNGGHKTATRSARVTK
jgi:probable rRNA maturation factor